MKYLLLIFFFFSFPAYAKWLEKDWNHLVCQHWQGKEEVWIDGGRVDCITRSHSIETDYAHKWQQAIGQSLYYSLVTGLKPGILVIRQSKKDDKYIARLRKTIKYYRLPIKIWKVEKNQQNEIELTTNGWFPEP